jgi:hypothetical protein
VDEKEWKMLYDINKSSYPEPSPPGDDVEDSYSKLCKIAAECQVSALQKSRKRLYVQAAKVTFRFGSYIRRGKL